MALKIVSRHTVQSRPAPSHWIVQHFLPPLLAFLIDICSNLLLVEMLPLVSLAGSGALDSLADWLGFHPMSFAVSWHSASLFSLRLKVQPTGPVTARAFVFRVLLFTKWRRGDLPRIAFNQFPPDIREMC